MAKQLDALDERLTAFVEAQKMYFVATAAAGGRVNVSPKGGDTLRVLGPNRIVWLNRTGSGNESAAHVLHTNRITVMFCAFEDQPLILRLYGRAHIVHPGDAAWEELAPLFPHFLGARQLFDVEVDLVQTSCGFGVPLMHYQGERELLHRWAERKGQAGIEAYWRERNATSIDGFATDSGFEPETVG